MKRNIRGKSSSRTLVRLNKFLAAVGVASRRKADEMIQQGKVSVNDRVVTTLGVRIDSSSDKVFVNGQQVVHLDRPVYILFNKPKDCITTTHDERGRMTVMDYVKVKGRVFPVGRLDRNTTGVLLLTNDGDFANHLMHPSNNVRKTYAVTLDKPLLPPDKETLAKGVHLSDGVTGPADVYYAQQKKRHVIVISIHEGRNRQIHRMLEHLGYTVEKLDRVEYGGITYEGVPRGRYRPLTSREVRMLSQLALEADQSG